MNKYFKAFALTGGVISAIIPTTLKIENKSTSNDLAKIYEDVTNMDEIKPRQSRINYKLNINTDLNSDENVSFATENENGEEKLLTDNETISYLDATLEEVSSEYNHLKDTLTKAIKETMDYLDNAKENNTLTNEQKIYLKEHTNSIKFLAETLEDLSEDVLCCIDGVDCNEKNVEEITAKYMKTINSLEDRINALQNSLNSLQLMNGISNPYFYATYTYPPNTIVYGLKYKKRNSPNQLENEQDNLSNSTENKVADDNVLNNKDNNLNSTENNPSSEENSSNNSYNEDSVENQQDNQDNLDETNSSQDSNSNLQVGEEKDYKTFNLKSNIDTYAPTRRNIDTFFNTALLDNEYGYGYGYGNGGMYGYGMPYGNMGYGNMGGYYGNPYGNMNFEGYNSNMINKKVLEENTPKNYIPNSPTANVEQTEDVQDNKSAPTKKQRFKRASNIDTYNQATIKSNINSMGESKISKYFKEKFNFIKDKVRNKKQQTEQNFNDMQDNNQSTNPNNTTDNENLNTKNSSTPNSLIDENNKEETKDTNFTTLEAIQDTDKVVADNSNNKNNLSSQDTNQTFNNGNFIKKEDIKAR